VSRKFQYNDSSVVLEGQVYTDFFFGRPNYGESPETDDIEHAVVLALDSPISVEGNGPPREGNFDAISEMDVDRVQLVTSRRDALRRFRGHGLRVSGSLFHAHTGHHHTSVLFSCEEEPVVIDSRNTYANRKICGTGSGFLLGRDGLIATAAHVLENATGVTVTRGFYRQIAAVIDVEASLDLAILKIEPEGVLANVVKSREARARPIRWWLWPRLGELVHAFGFPLGGVLPHSLNMTQGLISSERGIEPGHFQISAAIQPGNSGSPVFDEYGNLVGIVLSSCEPAQNVNFCIASQEFNSYCYKLGIRLNENENRDIKIRPTVLAEMALHFCVEVEAWADAPTTEQIS
jgi:S1-C subfamily serine protease